MMKEEEGKHRPWGRCGGGAAQLLSSSAMATAMAILLPAFLLLLSASSLLALLQIFACSSDRRLLVATVWRELEKRACANPFLVRPDLILRALT